MDQLHLINTSIPMHRHDMTYEEWQMVLESHMFLKDKQDEKKQGRAVAGGNKQRTYITKEYSSLPIVTTESVILRIIVNVKENSDIEVIYILNAFIQMRFK